MKKKKLIILIILGLILMGFFSAFGYWYFKVLRPVQIAFNFIKENLKPEFWPLKIKLESIQASQGKGVSTYWKKGEINLSYHSFSFDQKRKIYYLGIFSKKQKELNSKNAHQIFMDYFSFSPKKFDCRHLNIQNEEAVFCQSTFGKKSIDMISYKRLDREGEGVDVIVREIK